MTNAIKIAKGYLLKALEVSLNHGCKRIVFTDSGFTATDPLNRIVEFSHNDQAVSIDDIKACIAPAISFFRNEVEVGATADFREMDIHSKWVVESTVPLTLKPKTAVVFQIDDVIRGDASEFTQLRSLYEDPNSTIILSSHYTDRAVKAALACSCEINLNGGYSNAEVIRQSSLEETTRNCFASLVFSKSENPTSILRTWTETFNFGRGEFVGTCKPATPRTNSTNVSGCKVRLEPASSRASSWFRFSDIPPTCEQPLDTPPSWEVINAQREARRLKAKPRPPKTWHSTTAAVAEAFIDRKAHKGMVSGKSLYFYGPVAYSVGHSLPVAAYLPKPDGSTILLVAHPSGIGGTLSGTVGCSAVDIRDAARAKGVEFIEFDNLFLYTSIEGRTLKEFAFCAEFSKSDVSLPAVATLDSARLAEYLVRLRESAKDELADAFEASTFPTYRKASAYQGLARLCEIVATFSDIFQIDLPDIGNYDELLQLSKDMNSKANARLEDQNKRRKQKNSGPTP